MKYLYQVLKKYRKYIIQIVLIIFNLLKYLNIKISKEIKNYSHITLNIIKLKTHINTLNIKEIYIV